MYIFCPIGSLIIPHSVALVLKPHTLGSQIFLVVVFNFKGFNIVWLSETLHTPSLKCYSTLSKLEPQ